MSQRAWIAALCWLRLGQKAIVIVVNCLSIIIITD